MKNTHPISVVQELQDAHSGIDSLCNDRRRFFWLTLDRNFDTDLWLPGTYPA